MPTRRGSSASGSGDEEEPRRALTSDQSLRAGPLFVWAALQVTAIGLATARVPLAAQYPVIGEFHASQLLLAVQLPLAAMLMPVLLTNWRSTLAAAVLGGVLQLIAALLTGMSPIHVLPIVMYVAFWVGAMGLIPWSFRDSELPLTPFAGALCALVCGGPLLAYLGADLSSRSLDQNLSGPLLPLLRDWPSGEASAWVWLAAIIALTIINRLVFLAVVHRRRNAAD